MISERQKQSVSEKKLQKKKIYKNNTFPHHRDTGEVINKREMNLKMDAFGTKCKSHHIQTHYNTYSIYGNIKLQSK